MVLRAVEPARLESLAYAPVETKVGQYFAPQSFLSPLLRMLRLEGPCTQPQLQPPQPATKEHD